MEQRHLRPSFERIPTEIWQQILREALYWPGFIDLDDDASDQITFEREFRFEIVNTNALQEKEVSRRILRTVCRSWRRYVDGMVGGWLPLRDLNGLPSGSIGHIGRIDYHGEMSPDGLCRLLDVVGTQSRILTIDSASSSIDDCVFSTMRPLPSVKALDLRPSSTFLKPDTGLKAPLGFFHHTSSIFPNLTALIVEVPGNGPSNILSFPQLRRLSYRITGSSRISDGRRCAKIEGWELPSLVHLSIGPVACTADWRILMAGLRSWGENVETLSWEARFPAAEGILVEDDDWECCRRLRAVNCDTTVVHGKHTEISNEHTVGPPITHPFHKLIQAPMIKPVSSS